MGLGACCSNDDKVFAVEKKDRETLILRPREQYRFESTNLRGHFVTHRDGKIWVEPAGEKHQVSYQSQTTFVMKYALNGLSGCMSFELKKSAEPFYKA